MLVAAVALASCKPESIKDYEPVKTGSVSSIAGVWTGSSAIQRDNDAERKNFPYKSMDITNAIEFNKVKLTLNANGDVPGNFTIDYAGAAPILGFTTGTWKVDNAEKVGTISLINGTDTVKMVLGSYNLIANNSMLLRRTKTLLGKEAVTYEYNFRK